MNKQCRQHNVVQICFSNVCYHFVTVHDDDYFFHKAANHDLFPDFVSLLEILSFYFCFF